MTVPRIEIYKSKRELAIYDGDTLSVRYPIALGRQAEGPKRREGDGKTPEGGYSVCSKNENSKFHLSLGLSYPNIDDAKRGVAGGLIGQSEYRTIETAIRRGLCPPWDTALGGEIMIHGGGTQSDWTAGCIALDDEHIDLLYRLCTVGTEVTIFP
jgi:murein L,D-transpeptidase YafK